MKKVSIVIIQHRLPVFNLYKNQHFHKINLHDISHLSVSHLLITEPKFFSKTYSYWWNIDKNQNIKGTIHYRTKKQRNWKLKMKPRRRQHSTNGYLNDKDDTGCRQIIDCNGRQSWCREILLNQVFSSQGWVVNLSRLIKYPIVWRDLTCIVMLLLLYE